MSGAVFLIGIGPSKRMSKLAIISQPDQGVVIDVSGCSSLEEATHHLTSTLQVSSQFWKDMNVELNLGSLELAPEDVAKIIAIAAEVGVVPSQVFTKSGVTRQSLGQKDLKIGEGSPMTLPIPPEPKEALESEEAAEAPVIDEVSASEPESESEKEESAVKANLAERETAKTQQQAAPVVLYLRQTLRSGQAVSHKGHLVIIGDVNPGAELMAEGDITVWGALRGVAHAGIGGNSRAEIRALRLQAIQLRIAHAIARSPDRPRASFLTHSGPETARIVDGKIRIVANNPE